MLIATTAARELIELTEVDEPRHGPNEAVVAVHTVTLCGTDVHIWEDDYPASRLPLVQGHEISGTVRAVGEDAPLRWGSRVVVNPMVWCGECHACRLGRYNACHRMSVLGCHEDGGLRQQLVVPVDKLHPVPSRVPLGLAPLAEPASIALQAVHRGRVARGENVLVLGCGPIGLFATLTAARMGARVMAVDRVRSRLALAEAFGAAAVVLARPGGAFPGDDQADRIRDWSGGEGPSVVIEATGASQCLESAVDVVAHAGRVVSLGISGRHANLSMTTLPYKELDVLGSRNSLQMMPEALEVIADEAEVVARLVTHRFGLGEVEKALRTAASGDEGVGKVAVNVGPDVDVVTS